MKSELGKQLLFMEEPYISIIVTIILDSSMKN